MKKKSYQKFLKYVTSGQNYLSNTPILDLSVYLRVIKISAISTTTWCNQAFENGEETNGVQV